MGSEQDTDIHELDRSTVERIAAGEVVERPASVVKELVENGLDAGADRVEVVVEGDGTDLIRVRDDGHGMSEADVRAAVEEHTTSKIADIEDLESGLATLGFRGEALHTIGAVSRMEITTRHADADRGTRLRYEGGDVTSVEPAGCPVGTTVAVEDLFFNTPARKKYLKREATEFAHVNRVSSRYALANPDVAVSLEHDGRETFSTTGRDELQSAVLSVYGREVAEAMIPVVAGDPADPPRDLPDASSDPVEGPLSGIAGYVSDPETTRSNADYVSTFVNGRYVKADAVRDAAIEAYGGQLASDRYPFAVLYLDVPPGSVDVNVHPRKMSVLFEDEDAVRRQVRDAVREALLDHGLVRSSAPRGRSAPGETPVDPGSDSSADSGDRPSPSAGPSSSFSSSTGSSSAPPSSVSSTDPDGESPATGSTSGSDSRKEKSSSLGGDRGEGDGDWDPSSSTAGRTGGDDGSSTDGDEGPPETANVTETTNTPVSPDTTDTPDTRDTTRADRDRKFREPTDQHTLTGDRATPERDYDRLPRMRVLGQYDDTYVVAESPDGLVLIDQHAADERINYERLRASPDDGATAQRLADPVDLELTAGEAATAATVGDALADLGFEVEPVGPGDRVLRVIAVPAAFDGTVSPERIREVLDAFVDDHPGETVEELVEEFLADLACRPAITGNTSLTEGTVTDLLSALDACENPYSCPHGRPVVIEIDRDEIADRFERDYPGHG